MTQTTVYETKGVLAYNGWLRFIGLGLGVRVRVRAIRVYIIERVCPPFSINSGEVPSTGLKLIIEVEAIFC